MITKVQQASTGAAGKLQSAGMIKRSHGEIEVIDGSKLKKLYHCYGVVNMNLLA